VRVRPSAPLRRVGACHWRASAPTAPPRKHWLCFIVDSRRHWRNIPQTQTQPCTSCVALELSCSHVRANEGSDASRRQAGPQPRFSGTRSTSGQSQCAAAVLPYEVICKVKVWLDWPPLASARIALTEASQGLALHRWEHTEGQPSRGRSVPPARHQHCSCTSAGAACAYHYAVGERRAGARLLPRCGPGDALLPRTGSQRRPGAP
jgi:hypothetical protein